MKWSSKLCLSNDSMRIIFGYSRVVSNNSAVCPCGEPDRQTGIETLLCSRDDLSINIIELLIRIGSKRRSSMMN